MIRRFLLAALFPILWWQCQMGAAPKPILFGGAKAELTVSEVSERTLRFELKFAESQQAGVSNRSTVLAPFKSTEKLQTSVIDGQQQLRFGTLRVVIKPSPLTISVQRMDGKMVQQLTSYASPQSFRRRRFWDRR